MLYTLEKKDESDIKQNSIISLSETLLESVHLTVSQDQLKGKEEETIPQIEGLKYQKIPKDGHCLFNAVALYVGQDQQMLRDLVAARIEGNEELRSLLPLSQKPSVEKYLQDLREGREWADHVEIAVLMKLLDRPIMIIGPDGGIRNRNQYDGYRGEPIFVYYNGHNHYDAFLLTGEYQARGILNNRESLIISSNSTLTQLNEHSPLLPNNNIDYASVSDAHINNDLSSEVQVLFWKQTSNIYSGIFLRRTGHVALKVGQEYMSLWPSSIDEEKLDNPPLTTLATLKKYAHDKNFYTNHDNNQHIDTINEEKITVRDLNILEILNRVNEIKTKIEKGQYYWSAFANCPQRCLVKEKDHVVSNCSSLVMELLVAGGIKEQLPAQDKFGSWKHVLLLSSSRVFFSVCILSHTIYPILEDISSDKIILLSLLFSSSLELPLFWLEKWIRPRNYIEFFLGDYIVSISSSWSFGVALLLYRNFITPMIYNSSLAVKLFADLAALVGSAGVMLLVGCGMGRLVYVFKGAEYIPLPIGVATIARYVEKYKLISPERKKLIFRKELILGLFTYLPILNIYMFNKLIPHTEREYPIIYGLIAGHSLSYFIIKLLYYNWDKNLLGIHEKRIAESNSNSAEQHSIKSNQVVVQQQLNNDSENREADSLAIGAENENLNAHAGLGLERFLFISLSTCLAAVGSIYFTRKYISEDPLKVSCSGIGGIIGFLIAVFLYELGRKIMDNCGQKRAKKLTSAESSRNKLGNVRLTMSEDGLKRTPLKQDKYREQIQKVVSETKLVLGTAFSEGDCFFDAVSQALENKHIAIPGNSNYLPSKRLRILCDSYIKTQPKEKNWVKNMIEEDATRGGEDYQTYLVRVQFTQVEIEAKIQENIFPPFATSTWGRPAIEGRILCIVLSQQLNKPLKLHVIDLQVETIENKETVIECHSLTDKDKKEDVSSNNIDYTDNCIIHLLNYQHHYVPLINSNYHLNLVQSKKEEGTTFLADLANSNYSSRLFTGVQQQSHSSSESKQETTLLRKT